MKLNLTEDEQKLVRVIAKKGKLDIFKDKVGLCYSKICQQSSWKVSKLINLLYDHKGGIFTQDKVGRKQTVYIDRSLYNEVREELKEKQ
jgi:hypothetical protein